MTNDNFFYEAMLYVLNDQKKFCEIFNQVIEEIQIDEGIYFNLNISSEKDQSSNWSFSTKEQVQIFVVNNLMWIFVENVFENLDFLEKIESKLSKYISKVSLTNKSFIQLIFNGGFSENLLEIKIEGRDISEFDEDIFIGSFINKTFEFMDIINFKDIHIKYFKIQPIKTNAVLTLRYPNVIQFSDYIDLTTYQKLIMNFSEFIYRTNSCEGETDEKNNNRN
ncbi:hypothetical protein [Bacillus sp. JZ142]